MVRLFDRPRDGDKDRIPPGQLLDTLCSFHNETFLSPADPPYSRQPRHHPTWRPGGCSCIPGYTPPVRQRTHRHTCRSTGHGSQLWALSSSRPSCRKVHSATSYRVSPKYPMGSSCLFSGWSLKYSSKSAFP